MHACGGGQRTARYLFALSMFVLSEPLGRSLLPPPPISQEEPWARVSGFTGVLRISAPQACPFSTNSLSWLPIPQGLSF